MVELRCVIVFVGVVVGGRGAPWCHQPWGRCSRYDPCMSGWFGVGLFAFGLFAVRVLSGSCVVGAWRCQLRYGQLVRCWACPGGAGVSVIVPRVFAVGSYFVCGPLAVGFLQRCGWCMLVAVV